MNHGADPHQRNHGGHSLLDGAAFGGRDEIARYLISVGVEQTIHHAAALANIDALEALLDADPLLLGNRPAGGRWMMSPLHAAVLTGAVSSIEFLLRRGADVHAEDHNAHTPLALLEHSPRPAPVSVAELLITHGASPNVRAGHHGGTLLHRMVMQGDVDVTDLLVAKGADPDQRDWSGKTALHHAVSRNGTMVELVLKADPDLTLTTDPEHRGETALDYAHRLKKGPAVRLIEAAAGT